MILPPLVTPPASHPILLTLHPSAFTQGDPTFEADAVLYARRKGFSVWNLDYPLGGLSSELTYTAYAAKVAAQRGPVYAYGDSAGGTLAGRLAQKGLVRAAALNCPVVDVWKFLEDFPSVEDVLLATEEQANAAALNPYRTPRPIRAYAGKADHLLPLLTSMVWDSSDTNVSLVPVAGDHLQGGPPNAAYENVMRSQVDWLRARVPW